MIDTAQKRRSVVSHARPWHPPVMIPTVTWSANDIQQIGRLYSGILVGEAVAAGFAEVVRFTQNITRDTQLTQSITRSVQFQLSLAQDVDADLGL